uniref:Uncharacterized protein n=1 Tax=Ditylenchus dipsaci TaxID=166011 RepID=A0A915CSP9_9BILA
MHQKKRWLQQEADQKKNQEASLFLNLSQTGNSTAFPPFYTIAQKTVALSGIIPLWLDNGQDENRRATKEQEKPNINNKYPLLLQQSLVV